MITAEEFFRNKIKEKNPNIEVVTLSGELITAEEGMRWAHEFKQLSLYDAVKSLPNDEEVKAHIDTLPYYGTCTTEYNEGFEDGVKWLKEQIAK